MLKLSDYVGQILTDVATGREIADKNSAALSERYQADSFMKGMPVPHYTIDQATFDLPFMVVGVITKGQMDEGIVQEILDITKVRVIALMNGFLSEKSKLVLAGEEPEEVAPSKRKKTKAAYEKITATLAKNITATIEEEGLKIIKLLDLVDSLCADLAELLEKEFTHLNTEEAALFDEENIKILCEKFRRVLFNEYKDIISTTNGVIISASTGKLNEYAEDACLTSLKLTLREQDLDFIIEQDEKSGTTKHFLSLN